MLQSIKLSSIVMLITTFIIGGVFGYHYRNCVIEKDAKHFFGNPDKNQEKMTHDFFDYKKS